MMLVGIIHLENASISDMMGFQALHVLPGGIAVHRTSISEKILLPLCFLHILCVFCGELCHSVSVITVGFFSAEFHTNGCVAKGPREDA